MAYDVLKIKRLSDNIKDGLWDSFSSPALYPQALRELEEIYGYPVLHTSLSRCSAFQKNCNEYESLLKVSQNINASMTSLKNGGSLHELQSFPLLEISLTKMLILFA